MNSNIWAPHRQTDVVDLLGKNYGFSARLLAIIRTAPLGTDNRSRDRPLGRLRAKLYQKDDLEVAATSGPATSVDLPRTGVPPRNETSHYSIARQMINYQSVDGGTRCKLLGLQQGG